MINIVIPMAGAGSRFAKAGFLKPKPFIDVLGIPMICHVLENLKVENAHYILLTRKEHYETEQETVEYIKNHYNVEFVLIDKLTEGAACTVLHAHRLINNNVPLLIANSDQIVDMDINDYINDSINRKLDGSVLCFEDNHPKWSYAKLDKNKMITMIREKEVISPFATVGIYYFAKGSDFVENSIDMIARNERVNNEFYVAPVYNYAIEKGKKYGIYNIDKSQMHGTGTPEDLGKYIEFNNHNKKKKCKSSMNLIQNIMKDPSEYICIAVGNSKRYNANKDILKNNIKFAKPNEILSGKYVNTDKTIIITCGKTEEIVLNYIRTHNYQIIDMAQIINAKAKMYWDNKKEYVDVDISHFASNSIVGDYIAKTNKKIIPFHDFLKVNFASKKDLKCLSLGCGCGRLERILLPTGYFSKIDACDISSESIEEAKEKNKDLKNSNIINYFVFDMNSENLKENEYDFIIAHSCMHHIENLEFAYKNINKALKPNGIFYQIEFTGADRFQYSKKLLLIINILLYCFPKKWKRCPTFSGIDKQYMLDTDPSEAIRSTEIVKLTKKYFKKVKVNYMHTLVMHVLYNNCLNAKVFHTKKKLPGLNKLRTIFLCKLLFGIEKIFFNNSERDHAQIIARKK